jgi:hypothetical protein
MSSCVANLPSCVTPAILAILLSCHPASDQPICMLFCVTDLSSAILPTYLQPSCQPTYLHAILPTDRRAVQHPTDLSSCHPTIRPTATRPTYMPSCVTYRPSAILPTDPIFMPSSTLPTYLHAILPTYLPSSCVTDLSACHPFDRSSFMSYYQPT